MNVNGNMFPRGYIRDYVQKYSNILRHLNVGPERTLSIREPLSSEWYNMCNSETNIISQSPWTEDDNSNVVIITKDNRDNCYNAKDISNLMKNTDLHVRKWKERPGQNNDAVSMSMGFGFERQGPPFSELLTLAESSVVPSMKVREAPVVRPTETTEQSRRAFAERIAASRARQAAINMDEDDSSN